MQKRNKLLTIFITVVLLVNSSTVKAQENISCPNRYLTLVNPVRGRDLWTDKSLKPISDQYDLISKYNFQATWLVQYDTLNDAALLSKIKTFNNKQEIGVFLEISKNLAEKGRVIYPQDVAWFYPQAVFLSGYTQSERKKLIDELFREFKDKFGYFPKSVGAWWIDSYSLNYLKEKFGIKAAMIVADQKTTDNYGVWGQWWGVPYYPSRANILTPVSNLKVKQDVVILQWAQRDSFLAYGDGPKFSNYSLQANDYIRQGKDTGYFLRLVNSYLSCENKIGQITVGLETGIESVGYIGEYAKQLESLKEISNLKAVTLSKFYDEYKGIFQDFPKTAKIQLNEAVWELNPNLRKSIFHKEFINYEQNISFSDYFLPDKSNFLDRRLPLKLQQKNTEDYNFIFILILVLTFAYAVIKKRFLLWFLGVMFAFASFGLIFRSFNLYGWTVFFGPQLPFPILFKIILFLTSLLTIILITIKFRRFTVWFIPLSFGLDPVIQSLRYIQLSNIYYFGFAIDALRFIGIAFEKPLKIIFVNQDFPSFQAAAFLRLNPAKLFDSMFFSVILYPAIHIILGAIFAIVLMKLPKRLRNVLVGFFILLYIWHLTSIFLADPMHIKPIV